MFKKLTGSAAFLSALGIGLVYVSGVSSYAFIWFLLALLILETPKLARVNVGEFVLFYIFVKIFTATAAQLSIFWDWIGGFMSGEVRSNFLRFNIFSWVGEWIDVLVLLVFAYSFLTVIKGGALKLPVVHGVASKAFDQEEEQA